MTATTTGGGGRDHVARGGVTEIGIEIEIGLGIGIGIETGTKIETEIEIAIGIEIGIEIGIGTASARLIDEKVKDSFTC